MSTQPTLVMGYGILYRYLKYDRDRPTDRQTYRETDRQTDLSTPSVTVEENFAMGILLHVKCWKGSPSSSGTDAYG